MQKQSRSFFKKGTQMSKTTKSQNPSSISSSINLNGNSLINTTTSNGKTTSDINFSADQQKINDYIQSSLLSSIPKINTFLPETIENWNKEIDAYTTQGIKKIDDLYSPMIKDLQNNIASRFGNLDNSVFMDNLNNLESKRAESISDFAQNIQSKQSSLVDDELNRQYNYLNFLTGYDNNQFQRMLNIINPGYSGLSQSSNYLGQSINNSSSFNFDLKDLAQLAQIATSVATFL